MYVYCLIPRNPTSMLIAYKNDNKQSIMLAYFTYFTGHLTRTVLDHMCHHVTNAARRCLSFKLILANLLASSGNFICKW